MIEERIPLSMAEAKKYAGDNENVESFLKKFTKKKPEAAEKVRKSLQDLDLLKIKASSISKIIDVLPETKEDLNKIFVDVQLDEDESNKIIAIIKEFK